MTWHDPLDESLIGRDVELQLGKLRGRVRAAIRDPTLRRRVATAIQAPPERRVLDDEVDARLLADPSPDFAEDRRQVLGRLGTAVDHGEVQILGKPVSL